MGKHRKYSKVELEKAVADSHSIAQTLKQLGIVPAGGNYSTIKRYIQEYKIDTSHFTGQGHLKGKHHNYRPQISLDKVLVKNSVYQSSRLRIRLIRENIFEAKCYVCNNTEWQGIPIPLELEHINGDHSDNRLENLTLLCPNCHALTPTYRGRNKN